MKNLFKLFKNLLGKEDPVIVEAGAHYGEDSVRFLKTFPSCHLFCFEPDPRNIQIIKKYVSNPRLVLTELALSDCNGTVDFYQSYDKVTKETLGKYSWIDSNEYIKLNLSRSGASSTKRGIETVKKITVQSITFDRWMEYQNINIIDLLWLDVQGSEREVFCGASESLSKIHYIWVEYGATMYDGAMTREQTKKLLKKRFRLIEKYSSQGKQGDLLLKNRILD